MWALGRQFPLFGIRSSVDAAILKETCCRVIDYIAAGQELSEQKAKREGHGANGKSSAHCAVQFFFKSTRRGGNDTEAK